MHLRARRADRSKVVSIKSPCTVLSRPQTLEIFASCVHHTLSKVYSNILERNHTPLPINISLSCSSLTAYHVPFRDAAALLFDPVIGIAWELGIIGYYAVVGAQGLGLVLPDYYLARGRKKKVRRGRPLHIIALDIYHSCTCRNWELHVTLLYGIAESWL